MHLKLEIKILYGKSFFSLNKLLSFLETRRQSIMFIYLFYCVYHMLLFNQIITTTFNENLENCLRLPSGFCHITKIKYI